ncbi:MAG: hypothetical protein F4246_10845 [Rhodothermaceae bacterium]|nr:hypothetical protein [Rhodothermaceae bacterium]MXX58022.1 hypothetical protein [Rhodothermaceae bacterium]MYD19916.1 hypothetical protein [Rhodothermaceae bacterium]MYD57496.1 hypothetical protein [Rhodothermaceae bacterium]MYI44704.1 hypothetical protein [Rhodothermaceae bacterium]
MIVTLLILLHVLTASAWFGLSIRLGSQAKLAATGQMAVAVDGLRTLSLMGIMLIATFVFSMALLMAGNGYPGQMQYHAASALIVVLLGIQFVFLRPAWKRLCTAVEAGNINAESETTGDDASMHARKISMYAGIGHLFWLVLLVLMFWNRLIA